MTEGELIKLSLETESLVPEAKVALRDEMSKRDFGTVEVDQFIRETEAYRVRRKFRVFTINGIGTKPYGKREFRPDGSYLTTRWIVFCWLPLIPLNTLRVRVLGSGRSIIGFPEWSTSYEVLGASRPNAQQVLSVYGFVGGLFLLGELVHNRLFSWVCSIAWAFLPWLLRRRARKRVQRPV
jgi:hypothetical protein